MTLLVYFGTSLEIMKMKTKEDFWSEVREIANTRTVNETERRNLLKGLELLWKSGYYNKEP